MLRSRLYRHLLFAFKRNDAGYWVNSFSLLVDERRRAPRHRPRRKSTPPTSTDVPRRARPGPRGAASGRDPVDRMQSRGRTPTKAAVAAATAAAKVGRLPEQIAKRVPLHPSTIHLRWG